MMIEVLLVDDHPTVMEGTKLLLEQEGDMKVSLAHSGEEALGLAKSRDFDVMLFDLHMPDINGIDLAKQVLSHAPDLTILIYTAFEFKNHIHLMIAAGISGFVLKTANKQQLVTAIRCAMRGEVVLPLSLVKQLLKNSMQASEGKNQLHSLAISNKEHEILEEISKGKSNKEIAEAMLMSQRSLEYALTNLFQKLHVKSRIEAVMKAKQMGLLVDAEAEPLL